jgi:signal transduction histidine kinase
MFWVLYNTYSRNEKYQRELKEQNYTIHEQKNEIEAQNEELVQQQEQVFSMNERLELLVQERTLKLNRLNEKLIEYAYINSHLLRAPLCRIQGLRNLIKFDPANVKEYQVYLDRSLDELNEIIESISVILEDEDPEIIQEIQNKLRH